MAHPKHQLSLSDIARLAGVRRPVVSMWRRRPHPAHAFPSPVARVAGEERFDAAEVIEYLDATGRGNNPEAADDLVAHTKLAQVTNLDETTAVDGLLALIALATLSEDALTAASSDELMARARKADPDDTFLLREVMALGSDLERLAAHADDITNAAYSAKRAFELVLRRHAASAHRGFAATSLVDPARTLVAKVADALASDATDEGAIFVDVTDGVADLLVALDETYAGQLGSSVATLAVDSSMARLARRRLRTHDIHRVDVKRSDAGDFTLARTPEAVSVHLLQLPPASTPDLSDLDVLDAIDNLVLQLDDSSRAIVIGPASALVDRLPSAELERVRDGILRSDRLRAVVRLPKGLMPRAPRRALALWAIGPAHPTIPVAERWTVVADVSDEHLDDAVTEGIVTDVLGAMTPDERSAKRGHDLTALDDTEAAEQVVGHRFRFGRRVATSQLVLGRRSLIDGTVPRVRLDVHQPPGAEVAATAQLLMERLDLPALAGVRVGVNPVDAASPPEWTTVAQALTEKHLHMLPGNRLAADDLDSGPDGLAVLGSAEILDSSQRGSRRIALTTFATSYPTGRLTEPGDVVVCSSPRVGAIVDEDGGSVVLAPARILRIPRAGKPRLFAPTLAADVNSSADGRVRDWRRWPLRLLTPEGVHALARVSAAVDADRRALRDRLDALDRLTATLTHGLADRTVKISTEGD